MLGGDILSCIVESFFNDHPIGSLLLKRGREFDRYVSVVFTILSYLVCTVNKIWKLGVLKKAVQLCIIGTYFNVTGEKRLNVHCW